MFALYLSLRLIQHGGWKFTSGFSGADLKTEDVLSLVEATAKLDWVTPFEATAFTRQSDCTMPPPGWRAGREIGETIQVRFTPKPDTAVALLMEWCQCTCFISHESGFSEREVPTSGVEKCGIVSK